MLRANSISSSLLCTRPKMLWTIKAFIKKRTNALSINMLTCHSTLAFYQHIIWNQWGLEDMGEGQDWDSGIGSEMDRLMGHINTSHKPSEKMRWVEFKTLAHSTLQQPTLALMMCQCYRSPPNNQLGLAAVPTMHYEHAVVISTAECG